MTKLIVICVISCGLLASCGINPRVGVGLSDEPTHSEKMGWAEQIADPTPSLVE